MFGSSTSTVALSALLSLAAVQFVHADPTPSEPAPGNVYTEGETCHVAWEADTTGEWTSMNIELMTGPNDPMVFLTTVATVDATGDTTSLDFTCPTVSLHSAVYFYQFTSSASSNVTWTGRFTITDSTGTTVDPPNSTVIDGSTIQWGTGALTDASQFTAQPSYMSASTVAIESASGDASSVATSSAAATTSAAATATATTSATGSKKTTATSTASSAAATSSKSSSSNNASSESTSGAAEGRKVQMAFGMVAVLGSVAAFL